MPQKAVLLYSCDSIPEDLIQERYIDCDILTPHQVKLWVKDGSVLSRFRRYDVLYLHTPSLIGSTPPLLSGAAALFLGKRIEQADNDSVYEAFGWGQWLGIAWRHFLDRFSLSGKLERISFKLDGVESALTIKEKSCDFDPGEGRPLYLRSDLIYGLHAGGSVGHIAGVVNNLEAYVGCPQMFSVDVIPTVKDDIPCTIVVPENKQYWTCKEMSALCFSDTFTACVREYMAESETSFIYQRYCLNNTSGLELSLEYGIPFVVEYNGSEVWISRHWGSPLVREALSLRIEQLNLDGADCIVVVSDALRESLVMQGVEPEKILVNPNGVDTEIYRPELSGERVRNILALEGKTVIGFIGTFGRWHGAEILAEAFGLLLGKHPELKESLHLLFIGDGMMRFKTQEIIKDFEISEHVSFSGIVPQVEGPEYLAACDILVSPHVPNADGTPFFGSPTKLFEYMAMGRAIVASDLDQIGDVLDHGSTALLVSPGSASSLAEALIALHSDPELQKKLGVSARLCAEKEYSWRQHTRRIVDKLKVVCSGE